MNSMQGQQSVDMYRGVKNKRIDHEKKEHLAGQDFQCAKY